MKHITPFIIILVLLSLNIVKAQTPEKYKELSGEQADNQNFIARDYIRLLPTFHYKAKASHNEYNPAFVSHITNLFYAYNGNPAYGTANNSISVDVGNYVISTYGTQNASFISYLATSPSFDVSIPVYLSIPATSFKASINEFLPFNVEYNQPITPFSTDLPVGSLPGSVDVSPTGAATYQIPIAIPPGTAGMMPNLSIVYNSQSPGGMLGKGWSIAGFSSISRIPTNLQDDGFIDGVDFDANDKFALNGNRLVEINGAYGADGTEYRTQMETFSKIFSYGSAGGGPEKFLVETKDGTILEYGYTEDSRFIADGRYDAVVWLLNKVTDKFGNYYTIQYVRNNKEYYPIKIQYTGNTTASLTPYNTIKFKYGLKSDPSIAFVSGSEVSSTVLLNEIDIECEGNIVNKYTFKYDGAIYVPERNIEIMNPSKLKEIVFYAGNNYVNSTKISWGAGTDQYFAKDLNATTAEKSNFISGDYNGDGKTDLVQIKYDDYGKVLSLDLFCNASSNNNPEARFNYSSSFSINSNAEFYPGDFNGDGKSDLLYISKGQVFQGEIFIKLLISNGFNFTEINSGMSVITGSIVPVNAMKFNVGDFNGDGKTDFIILSNCCTDNTIEIYTWNDWETNPNCQKIACNNAYNSGIEQHKIADFNGDGKSDIMLISDQYNDYSCQIFGFESSVNSPETGDLVLFEHGGFPTKDHRIFPGDFNGDGKTDILTWVNNSTAWEIHYFGENDFIWTKFPEMPNLINSDPTTSTSFTVLVSDYNGDGKEDIFQQHVYSPGHGFTCKHTIFYGTGTSFRSEINIYSSTEKNTYPSPHVYDYKAISDFNGDGKQDVLIADYEDITDRRILFFHANEQSNLVQKITNGFNKEIKIEYQPYTSDNIYLPGSGNDITNDVIEIRPPITVVSKISRPNGIGGNGFNYRDYWYQGLKLHKKGKGLLGFETVYSEDNFESRDDMKFGYEPVFFSTFLKKQISYNNATFPKETNIENKLIAISTALGGKRYLPYVDWKEDIDSRNDITIKSEYVYDDYGNVTSEKITHGADGITQITNVYDYNKTWCPSAIISSSVTKTRSGKTPDTQLSSVIYENGYLKSSTEKGITTEYKNNIIGLPYEITVSAQDETSKKSTIGYDSKWRFADEETNPLGFVTKKTHDPKNGNVLTEKDILGHVTSYKYDSFGNLHETTLANGNKITINSKLIDNGPINSAYYVEQIADGSAPVKTYYTHLGQEIQTETVGFNGSPIYSKTEYNLRGQVSKKYEPSFSIGGGAVTTYDYDTYGKIYLITSPIGLTYYFFSSKTSTIVDPSGKLSFKTINAYGDVILAHDNGGDIVYDYNSAGQPETITAPGSSVVSFTYYPDGSKKSITDPDAGTINYTYTGFGNLKTQIDSKGNQYSMVYDILGRIISKQGPEGTTSYVYDVASNGKGQIASATGPNGISQSFEYDQYGRMIKSTELVDNIPFVYHYTYDQYGRDEQTIYPSGFAIKSIYQNGFLTEIRKVSDNGLIWKTETENEFGQLIQGQFGNNKRITNTYDGYHNPSSFAYEGYATLGYNFDKETGNLDSRSYSRPSLGINLTETFTYDNLNRLDVAKIGNNDPYLDMQYANNGNIVYKNDAGNYLYNHPSKLHAVTDITGNTGTIDTIPQTIDYNSFNKVSQIEENNYILQFTYGLDHERRKTVLSYNGNVTKTKYFIGAYEVEITTNNNRKIHYISGGNGLVAAFIIDNTHPEGKMYYTYTDHLGSISAIADESGNILEEQSFDPWGRRRNPTNWSYENIPAFTILYRGFTGHEHLYEFGLINMNGRLYDPFLGRMLSPDPFVQAPDYSQNFNRYSYCLNNPLIYTDPSGEFLTWNIGNGGFSIGLNFGLFGFGLNVGYGAGFSLGCYGEIGPRVGGSGFGSGATISQSIDFNFKHNNLSTTSSVGVYASIGGFNAGANISLSYDITNKQMSTSWGINAGIGFGNDERGIGLNIGYGSEGFSYGIGGYYNSKAWDSNPIYDPEKDNKIIETLRKNCYAYLLDEKGEIMQKLQPGEISGSGGPILITLDEVLQLSIKDGRVKVPNFFNKLGFGKKGYYSGYLVIDNAFDYHWYRQDKGGTWSHKPGYDFVTNLDASRHIIRNPANANHNYFWMRRNYTDGGIFVWVKAK